METVLNDEDVRVTGFGNQCKTSISLNSLLIDETMIDNFIKSFKSKAGTQIIFTNNVFTINGIFTSNNLNRILSEVYREIMN